MKYAITNSATILGGDRLTFQRQDENVFRE